MFFKKKPKKTWLEQQMDFERKNDPYKQFRCEREEIRNDQVDAIVNALTTMGRMGISIDNLKADVLDASRIEVTPLYATMSLNEMRAICGLKEV